MKTFRRTLLAATMTSLLSVTGAAQAESIQFWSMPYGDKILWDETWDTLTSEFQKESGIEVNQETVAWGSAFQTYLTAAQGGVHPDCADMYWLHSFSAIGGDKHGPMPINDYRDRFPDLEKDFYSGALQDVLWQGDFYGIPWRGDIRSILYRTDVVEEVGLSGPPTNWEETIEATKAMTVRDDKGDVDRWGYAFGTSGKPVDWLLPFYWQAGGEMMTEDGKTATIDNDAMRDALGFMHDMVHVHKVADADSFEKGYETETLFVAGKIALIGTAHQNWGKNLDEMFPEIDGTWAFARSATGSAGADSFSGAGYFGVLRGTEKTKECVTWLEFLSRDENMLRLSEASGNVGTKPAVMASEIWSNRPWKLAVGEALQDAHTSQHPAPAWSSIATSEPGGILYDLIYNTVVLQKDMDAEIGKAQELMQAELAR